MSDLVKKLAELLQKKDMTLACAESCTGGMFAAAITDRPGSSSVFERGFVTYSNESKQELLGVAKSIIDIQGAVSSECAKAMALGALKNSHADIAISITGIAGPDGGSEDKPVGLVYFSYATKDGLSDTIKNNFKGDRASIRQQSVQAALTCLIAILEKAA